MRMKVKVSKEVGMYTRPCLQLVRLQRANNLLSSQHPCIHYNVKKFSYNEHPFARCKRNPLSYYYYRPQTKLREGNVFTGICLFTGRGSQCNHYPWCIGPRRYLSRRKVQKLRDQSQYISKNVQALQYWRWECGTCCKHYHMLFYIQMAVVSTAIFFLFSPSFSFFLEIKVQIYIYFHNKCQYINQFPPKP